jgi:endonuclease G, mitochondrial
LHLILGNPSHHTQLDSQRYRQFLRPQYALLFDRTSDTAAWASWQLNRDWLGNLKRPPFEPDPELPQQWDPVLPHDYTDSGFDRGHLVPAADRNRTPQDLAAVFYMTNIVPQAPDNNRGPWEELEHYCRELVQSGKELYIMAGPMGEGGIGRFGRVEAIAHHKITVPAALWKIIVVNPTPGLGLKGINGNTRTIAVLMPNQQGLKLENWQQFRTTIRTLEAKTGYDFLSNVPADLQNVLENHLDGVKLR